MLSGFVLANYMVGDQQTTVLLNEADPSQVIIQVLNADGSRGLMVQTTNTDGTISMVAFDPADFEPEETSEESTDESVTEETSIEETTAPLIPVHTDSNTDGGLMGLIMGLPLRGIAVGFGVILLLLIVALIVLNMMNRRTAVTRPVEFDKQRVDNRMGSSDPSRPGHDDSPRNPHNQL